jgi:hypothetical protein
MRRMISSSMRTTSPVTSVVRTWIKQANKAYRIGAACARISPARSLVARRFNAWRTLNGTAASTSAGTPMARRVCGARSRGRGPDARGLRPDVSRPGRSACARQVPTLVAAGSQECVPHVAFGVAPATIKSRLREGREQAKRKLMPVVRELLSLQPRSAEIVEPTMPRYGKPGCACARITDGR